MRVGTAIGHDRSGLHNYREDAVCPLVQDVEFALWLTIDAARASFKAAAILSISPIF
jgi:hypothetical protein